MEAARERLSIGFEGDIERLAENNRNFRQVIHTGKHSQVVLMSLQPGEEIGEEVHPDVDQILVFVDGEGEAILEGRSSPVEEDTLVFVPAGTTHNFTNTGDDDMKLYTVYSPPQHPDGTVHRTKADAMAAHY